MEFSPMTAQYGRESRATGNPGPGLSPAAYGGTLPHRWPPPGPDQKCDLARAGDLPMPRGFPLWHPLRSALASNLRGGTGTLIMDIAHSGSRTLVWRGSAESEVTQSTDSATRNARISVRQILERFPP
jgi:hypothetical protein